MSARHRAAVLAFSLLLEACGDKRDAQACVDYSNAIVRDLSQARDGSARIDPHGIEHPVTVSDADVRTSESLDLLITSNVDASRISFGATDLSGTNQIARLDAHLTILRASSNMAPQTLGLLFPREATVATLREFEALNSDVSLVALGPSARLPARPSFLPDDQSLQGSERAPRFAAALDRALGECEALRAVAEQTSAQAMDDRLRFVRRELPRALRECECGEGIDLPALRYLVARTFLHGRPARLFPLRRDSERHFVLPSSITEAHTVQQLVDVLAANNG